MGRVLAIEPGMFSTIQDLGREGWSPWGVPVGGACDTVSLRIGNWLVGNEAGAAGLEMTLIGGTYRFEDDAIIALAGAEADARVRRDDVDGEPVPMLRRVSISAGSTLRIGPLTGGSRCYLCIGGGINAVRVMGSASTHVGAGFGGIEGRALRRGDCVEFGVARPSRPLLISTAIEAIAQEVLSRRVLRAVDGSHAALFADPSSFWGCAFTVSNRSDRVGIRLEGNAIEAPCGGRMTSEGMMWGAVEVPADGHPIILMADHPTTGGYPVRACIATVDLPVLGQLRPGDVVRLERITARAALALLRERESHMAEGMA